MMVPWCPRYCKNNPDPAFASCDVPAEIADDQQLDSPAGLAEVGARLIVDVHAHP